MIASANFKVNLGLYVTERRNDGFHNLETIFIPVDTVCDTLEIVPNSSRIELKMEGGDFSVEPEKNLCVKAFQILQQDVDLSGISIKLVKRIPSGAGLGGGSSDAAAVLKAVNDLYDLRLTDVQLCQYAARLGSDVPFFILNRPVYATGRGEVMRAVDLDLSDKVVSVFKPDFSISTAEAYARVVPQAGRPHLCDLLAEPLSRWRELFPNDFEDALFPLYPILAEIKRKFYDLGAEYAALSGSGSAVFAIAPHPIDLSPFFLGQNLSQ